MNELNPTQSIQDNPADDNDLSQRRIRSFVLRQGRLTKGQARALETVFPKFGITYQPELLDLNAKFGRADSKKILEIGFGMGETTAKIAATLPECDFLAAEVHTPGVGALLKLIDEQALT
ncbi:MAG: tRNA (guanosine(46)-N7)-methyltransferase TrmB, partial [Mehylophilales bacterium 35-46-6]